MPFLRRESRIKTIQWKDIFAWLPVETLVYEKMS